MPSDTAPSDAYEVVLADLRAKRAQIDQAISAIEALRGSTSLVTVASFSIPTPVPTAADTGIRPGSFHGMSIAEAAKAVMATRKESMGTGEIADAIVKGGVVMTSANIPNTVGSILNRQSKMTPPEIVSVGRGRWGLAAWYRNPGRFQKSKDGEKSAIESSIGSLGPASDHIKEHLEVHPNDPMGDFGDPEAEWNEEVAAEMADDPSFNHAPESD
jgi:DNA-directed RNA polymerase delta subunit